MPESPEVQALADALGARLQGRALIEVDILEFRVVKTRARPPERLVGERLSRVDRFGKLLDLVFAGGAHLVVSLGRHGWARWADGPEPREGAEQGEGAADPAREVGGTAAVAAPALAMFTFDDAAAVEFTDAGSWVSLACWVVDDPNDVPAVAKLGPDPAADEFTRADFDAAIVGRRKQVKAVLHEQESLAGIGNAYSDEILHAAKVSPVVHAAELGPAELDRLYAATVDVVRDAIVARRGVPIDQLKAAKVAAMQVHGRTGEPCPVCGGIVADFRFAGTTAQYCPTCQTGGALLPLKG